jgi:hypothetical protein
MASDDDDATVRLPPPRLSAPAPPPPAPAPARRSHAGRWAALLALLVLAGAGGGFWWFRADLLPPAEGPPTPPAPPPRLAEPAAPPTAPVPPAAAPTVLDRLAALPPLLDEAAIDAHRAATPTLLRHAANPAVFVIDFPSLDAQGAAMNRVAALVEKAGLPRDRVLNEAEMAAAIARAGDTPGTFYYGHNYRGADLLRFFRLAAEAAMPLRPEEEWLRAQALLARSLVPAEQEIVLVSIAAPDERMAPEWRATVLRHELGHGLFGTRPAYAAHIRRVWREGFTEAVRAAFRAFLGREGYDTADDERMLDEMQAYMLHTPNPRFFNAAQVGMDEAALARLRGLLRNGLPGAVP